jgi:hypothetical protein
MESKPDPKCKLNWNLESGMPLGSKFPILWLNG